jgi:hypothetical protein
MLPRWPALTRGCTCLQRHAGLHRTLHADSPAATLYHQPPAARPCTVTVSTVIGCCYHHPSPPSLHMCWVQGATRTRLPSHTNCSTILEICTDAVMHVLFFCMCTASAPAPAACCAKCSAALLHATPHYTCKGVDHYITTWLVY